MISLEYLMILFFVFLIIITIIIVLISKRQFLYYIFRYNYLYTRYSSINKYLEIPKLDKTESSYCFVVNGKKIKIGKLYKFYDDKSNIYLVDPKEEVKNNDLVVVKLRFTNEHYLCRYVSDKEYYIPVDKNDDEECSYFQDYKVDLIVGVVVFKNLESC